MSSHPNTYICAVLKSNTPNFFENLIEEVEEIEFNGVYYGNASSDRGMFVSEEEDTHTVYEYITYGWGDTATIPELLAKIEEFGNNVATWCLINNCTATYHIGADWF